MVLKVVVGFLVVVAVAVEGLATDIVKSKSPKEQWVDSLINRMTLEEKLGQLLYLITEDPNQVPSYVGGVITRQNASLNLTTWGNGLQPLIGFIANDYLFKKLNGIKSYWYNATGNFDLINKASQMAGNKERALGLDFIFEPGKTLPAIVQDPVKNRKLRDTYVKGLEEVGLMMWSDDNLKKKSTLSGLALTSELSQMDFDLDKVSARNTKRFNRGKSNQLYYHRTSLDDDNRLSAFKLADIFVIEGDAGFYLDELTNWVSRKKIKKKTLIAKVRRVLNSKYDVINKKHPPLFDPVEEKILKRELTEGGITIVRDQQNQIPYRKLDGRHFASLSFGVFDNQPFKTSLDHYTYFSHFEEVDFLHDAKSLGNTLTYYDHVIVGFSFPDHVDVSNLDVLERIEFLKKISEKTHVTVVVFAGNKWLESFSFIESLVMAYDNARSTLSITPQILFGGIASSGEIPFDLGPSIKAGSGIATKALGRLAYTFPEQMGFDSLMEKKIDYIISAAIDSAATPGCQVLVAKDARVILEKAYGYFTYDSIQPVTRQTIYDLASVTKVVGTLQATMFLEGRGEVELDVNLSDYLSELKGTNKENLLIRKVLTHQAGLRSYFPFYQKTFRGDRLSPRYYQQNQQTSFDQIVAPGIYGHKALEDSVWSWTIQSRLREKPEWQTEYDYQYSDLGFLMMHKLNERLLNQPIEDFLSQNFYEPLGMSSTGYQPLCKFPLHDIAPTEIDYDFRNALVWGMVHDENAALTGGVGGHAGIFSTANDLAILMQMNLQDGYYGGLKYLEKGTVTKFAQKQFPGNRRGLGWDKPQFLGDYKNTSRQSSVNTFGHLGFTGTAIWVDPDYDLIYIFLSNRVHPNRENDKLIIENIRSKIHDVIYQSMSELHRDS